MRETRMANDLLKKGKALWAEFTLVHTETYASSLAYFAFLSLVPLLALCISLISMFGVGEQDIVDFLMSLVPNVFDDFARTVIHDAVERSGIALSISTLTLLWTASKGVQALRKSLNVAYGVQESRNAIAVALISVAAALILGIMLAFTVYLVFSGSVMRAISGALPGVQVPGVALNIANSAVMMTGGVIVLAACYAYLPDGRRRFAAQLPGALLGSVACGLLTIGFHIYVEHFGNYNVLYGSLATIALFLFWMYLVSFILIMGAFVNRMIADKRDSAAA